VRTGRAADEQQNQLLSCGRRTGPAASAWGVRAGSLWPTCDPGAEASSGSRASRAGSDSILCRGGFRKFCAKSGPRLLPSPQGHDPLRPLPHAVARAPGALQPLGPAAVTICRHLARIFVTVCRGSPVRRTRLRRRMACCSPPLEERARPVREVARTMHEGTATRVAQFLVVCSRLKRMYTSTSRPRKGSPLCMR